MRVCRSQALVSDPVGTEKSQGDQQRADCKGNDRRAIHPGEQQEPEDRHRQRGKFVGSPQCSRTVQRPGPI